MDYPRDIPLNPGEKRRFEVIIHNPDNADLIPVDFGLRPTVRGGERTTVCIGHIANMGDFENPEPPETPQAA
jgi:hypothetical protein